MSRTVEKQYEAHLELKEKLGLEKLGIEKNANWYNDPRRLVFVLSRYKFVSKMLSGKNSVLEVGCGDGFAVRLVLQEVGNVHATDIDQIFINDANERMNDKWNFTCERHDILSSPVKGMYEAAFSLDVLEHISKDKEDVFFKNISASLVPDGIFIVGMPTLESQNHASYLSKIGHVNCKTGVELKELASGYFKNVFIFCMNDEVVHTGFQPMAQYIFALCVGKKNNE